MNFYLKFACYKSNLFDFDVVCLLPDKFTGLCPKDFFCRLHTYDLKRLVQYFEKHRQSVMNDTYFDESPVYMPLEMDFKIQCLAGDIEDPEDGYFSINIFINCGRLNEDGFNTYFGFDSIIDVLEVTNFCKDIESLFTLKKSELTGILCTTC